MSRCQGLAVLIVAAIGAVPATGWSQVEEIVVTTRRKAESLQDVPIAVDAITSEQIARQGVADLDDIVQNNPSVQFDRSFGPSDTRITIRGLSNTRGRSNVAFLVDGIDVTTENLIVAGSGLLANRRLLADVERIEVVKGPQSALYGRAAFAGAFNYITKEPGDVFEGNTRVDMAQDGFQQVDAALGGPVSDTLGMRLTGFWYNQDGHYVNQMSGDDVGGSGGSGAALTAVWKPDDITRVKVRGEYSREDYDPLANIRIGGGWQDAPGVRLFEYPDAVLQNAQNLLAGLVKNPRGQDLNALGATVSRDATGLIDFNQYCPDALKDPDKGPGLCLPTNFGSADGRVVKHSENPLTGQDFDGTDLETFRLSAIASFDMDGGVLTSYTGWTNFNASDNYDQDWQAESDYKYTPPGGTQADYLNSPSPDFYNGRVADQLTAGQIAKTSSEVDQFSQELRFASKLDGPVQYTLGALYWDETRQLEDSNSITACLPLDKGGNLQFVDGNFVFPSFFYQDSDLGNGGGHVGNVCDGGPGPTGFPTTIGWQEYFRQLQPQPASYWEANTRSWSFYANLQWEIADRWTLDLEDRFVSESFRLQKPNQSSCTTLGYIGVIGQSLQQEQEGVNFDAICAYQDAITPGGVNSPNESIRSLEASVDSHFNTPKVTLNWKPTDDSLVYVYWARAEKPGGINQLTGGGAAGFAKSEVFDAEKLQAWELGSKNTFDVGGPLLANVALFFQDYTDKQTNTQVIDASGVSQPRTLNASGAEIWGAEFEFTWQPDFVEGLVLNAAYTYLDAEYTKFVDDITSLQRLAYAGQGCTLIYKNTAGEEVTAGTPGIASAACRVDLGGRKLERTPEHALALGASYTRPLTDTGLDLLVELSGAWQDKRYTDQDNGAYFDAYWNVDTRLGLIADQYEILAYVDNLLDDDTIRSGGSGPDFGRQVAETGFTAGLGVSHFFGSLPDPRIFGIRASYKFGGE